MADIPIVQFPSDQSPALTAAITMLLCTVLGGIVHIAAGGVSTAATDGITEADVTAMVTEARTLLVRRDEVVFKKTQWGAAGRAASA